MFCRSLFPNPAVVAVAAEAVVVVVVAAAEDWSAEKKQRVTFSHGRRLK